MTSLTDSKAAARRSLAASSALFRHPDFAASPERASHGWCRRLDRSVTAASVADAFAGARDRDDELSRDFTMWVETLATASDAPASVARRQKELARRVDGERAAGRIVVLGYSDGVTDLIIVGHRARVDFAGLRRMGALLTGAAPGETANGAPVGAPEAIGAQPIEWGCGDGRRARQSGRVAIASVAIARASALDVAVAASALLLARYGTNDPRLALLSSRAGEGHDLRAASAACGDDATVVDALRAASRSAPLAPIGERDALPTAGLLFTELDAGEAYVACAGAVFPLTFVWELSGDDRLEGAVWFDEGTVAPSVAEQLARHVGLLAEQLARGAAERKVQDLELLSDAEARRILEAGRTPPRGDVPTATIHALFEKAAAANPDAPAVSDDSHTLTYRELDQRADEVAAGLHVHGVRRGDKVGVCLERNVDLVVTLLGVLKAGAAYVPMDANYPPERLLFTVADAGVAVVVSDAKEFPRAERVDVLTPAAVRAKAGNVARVTTDVQPTDLAYVIYTSGSTGRPKGVAIPHKNVATLLDATMREMALGARDTWTLFHSSAFDFSVWEIWGCLLTGGHLVVVSYWVTRSPEEFYDLLVRRRVTVLSQTPSAFAALQAVDERRRAPLAVRIVVFGGEALDVKTLGPWFRRHPSSECVPINMFGITETTVHVTWQSLTPAHVVAGSKSVGRALPGWSMSVRDTRGRVQPFGVPGEIYVGGDALASHYLNRDDLTTARFVTDPVTRERLYRSGDLGRMHADGTLDHLGRIDSQVKIRGFRIELDEIRSVLLESPGVTAAAVLVSRDGGDAASVQLDAYVCVQPGTKVDELRRRAAKYLPDYMMPSSFTEVAQMPVNGNGKLDADALRKHKAARGAEASAAPAATDAKDEGDDLLRVWRQVIGRPVAADDDFFESGGNSLLAVHLTSAIRKLGFTAFSLRDLYTHSTPAAFSAFMAAKRAPAAAQ